MTSASKTKPETAASNTAHRDGVLEALSRQFRAPLVRFFEKRIGRQSETEDLVQEVFVRLADGDRIESVQHMEAYLFKTAANLLRDRQRRLSARASDAHDPYEDEIHGLADEAPTPERTLAGAEAVQQVVTALQELPERTRNVWLLYHVDDLPHAAIARQLSIAISTIEKHLRRANLHLLKRVDRSTW
jgi:RNA polymerase sigma factor (sigma-70 family)